MSEIATILVSSFRGDSMKRVTQIKILKELMDQLDRKKNIDAGCQLKNPTASYVNRELADREWTEFFRTHPQMVGLSGDLPRPGSYLTLQDFGVPILATRDKEGVFHAFLNACRHRGTRLTSEQCGEQEHFVCPFHNWTYKNTGELVGIAREQDFGNIDRTQFGLIELPSAEKHGLLWVHPDPHGNLDPELLLGELGPEIDSWNLSQQVFTDESILNKNLNWKLANDTFGETYHFTRLHKNTVSRIFYGDALAYETFGRNHRFCFPTRGIDTLRTKPETEWRMDTGAAVVYYLFPNIQLVPSEKQITLFRIYPDPKDPSRSTTRIRQYFSPSILESIDEAKASGRPVIDASTVYEPDSRGGGSIFGPDASREVFISTLDQEDYAMGESTQRAAEAGVLKHLIFGRNEPALHHFHSTFRDALNLPPLERISEP